MRARVWRMWSAGWAPKCPMSMATYTGKVITWEMALNSQENLGPDKYEFGPLAVAPVAVPGVTKFS